ncbi:MAG TPA: hypothetical protein VHW09_26655 [Bryobacteraceae bacterium]|jgi:hypothetical protein|nr:hypothetical protein [Bryobacteraceae bacterium]
MTDLSDIALAFCRECLGWHNATKGDWPFSELIGNGPLPGSECFGFADLNTVMDAVRAWLTEQEDLGLLFGINRHGDYLAQVQDECYSPSAVVGGDIYRSEGNPCRALMEACLEAARKLKGEAA